MNLQQTIDTTLLEKEIDSSNQISDKKGKLKIFLGYCAGVGKTYRMLQEGIVTKHNGGNVVVGIVETHGRVETEALVRELEVIPRKSTQYSGITVTEMDLDRILELHPQLVLVDELAHTNMPGSRHDKRFQDIEELLNAGIDIHTTLNIQHIQSQVDIVYQITGVKVEETIPNQFLEAAVEIELVDLPPEKLQQRLAEGKVYIPQKAKLAMQKFFKKGNLLALRELSLKYTAKRVDTDLLTYREREEIADVWPVESKLLVGISSNKNIERILLIAHRMASDLNAEWYAVHVESMQQVEISEKARNQIYRNINLAEELGANVVSLSGNNIADEIIKFAKQKNVTLIITGLSQRTWWQKFIKGSVITRLVKEASPINVMVVGETAQNNPPPKPQKKKPLKQKPYIISLISVIAIFGLSWLFPDWILEHNILLILLLPAIISGILGGVLVGLFTSVVALGLYDFFFITPTSSFAIEDIRHLSNLILFVFIVFGTSFVGRVIRWRADSAKHREKFVYALYNFSRKIIGAKNFEDILNRAMHSTVEAFESDVIILLPEKSGALKPIAKNRPNIVLNKEEWGVANWVYKNARHAGKGTRTLTSAKWYYVPIKTKDDVLGVISLIKTDTKRAFSPEQRRLLEAFAGVIGLALVKANK